MNRFSGLATAVLTLAALTAQAAGPGIGLYQGPCDASAATALDAAHFVVGADEGDTLYIYRRSEAAAVASIDLSGFLGTKTGEESDIEAAAAIGTRIYWITSHGRNGKGKVQHTDRTRPGPASAVGPEALFATGSGKEVQLLSDDGGILVRGVECKTLPKASQTFRSLIISP